MVLNIATEQLTEICLYLLVGGGGKKTHVSEMMLLGALVNKTKPYPLYYSLINAPVSLETTALLGDTSLVYFFPRDSVGRVIYNKDRGEMQDIPQG